MQAQQRTIEKDPKVQFVEMATDKGTPQTIRFNPTGADAYRAADAVKVFKKHLQLKVSDKLAFLKNTPYRHGLSVARYQQFYKGVKVEHGQFTALSKDDRLAAMSGEFYELEEKGIAPTLSEAQALESALRFVGAKEYVWEYVASLRRGMLPAEVMRQIDQAYGEYFPKGELVFVDDFYQPGTEPELAWKFNIYANEPLSRAWIYVNAHDGRILLRDAIIKHSTASVQTRYAGIQEIGTTFVEGLNPNPEYGGEMDYYILLDETRGNGVQTYDMNGLGGAPVSVAILYSLATEHVDDDNTWTTTEHVRDPAPTIEEAINDDIAWDAHWGASMVYDYWGERHGRLSYDGENAKINSYIHYGEGYDNAFWNGSVMTYGDGSYKNFGATQINGFAPLTSLDVCGHEIGHAVCETTADLVYERESGAMNEGFSDIWAACMENYVAERFPGTSFGYAPFKIGEQIDFRTGPNDPNNALRYMDNPKGAGDPDTYAGTNWTNPNCGTPTLANDYCGVHGNSGVLNKWFYLLVVGSGNAPDDGVNDQSETYDVDGLGFETAEQIAFGTELLLTPTATFAQARAAAISFARATFGPCSPEEEATTNAWYAVGVGDEFACSGGDALTGFLTTNEDVAEAAENTGACGDSKTHEVKLSVNSVLNFNLQVGGTATQGSDYTLSTTNVTHGSTAFSIETITIT
ncbi:MAG: M4 family metallopeptidase, partial [Bacteroidota bacterium]